jgi:hypothetical protein
VAASRANASLDSRDTAAADPTFGDKKNTRLAVTTL